jgi:hypothetical protein
VDAETEQLVIVHTDTPVQQAAAREPVASSVRSFIAGAHAGGAGAGYGGTYVFCGDEDEALDSKCPSGTRLQGNFPTFVAFKLPAGQFIALHLRRLGTRTVAHKRARDVRMYGRESQLKTKTPNGLLVILPMPAAGLNGGPAAAKQLLASLQSFMQPLLKPGSQYVAPDELMHAPASGQFADDLMSAWRSTATQEQPYTVVKEPTVHAYGPTLTPAQKANLVRYAAADWSADDLDESFDLAGMLAPHDRDASAVADRAAELQTLEAEWEDARCKTRSDAVTTELRAASEVTWQHHAGVYDHFTQTRAEGSWSRSVPLARLKMALVPEAAGSLTGELVIELYVLATNAAAAQLSTAAQHCRPLFAASADGPGDRHSAGGGTAMALRETLNTLLERESPNHAANARAWRELEHRHGRDPSVTTIPGLLAAVEAQERPEAPQPPGLNVQLRPYQRQALRFMIDAEQVVGAGPMWSELPLLAGGAVASGSSAAAAPADDEGDRVWFSPLLNRLSREAPTVVAGGMLSSEMARASARAAFNHARPAHLRRLFAGTGQDGHQPGVRAGCAAGAGRDCRQEGGTRRRAGRRARRRGQEAHPHPHARHACRVRRVAGRPVDGAALLLASGHARLPALTLRVHGRTRRATSCPRTAS